MVTGQFNWMCVGWREWERLQNWCLGVYINMAWFGEPTDSAEGEWCSTSGTGVSPLCNTEPEGFRSSVGNTSQPLLTAPPATWTWDQSGKHNLVTFLRYSEPCSLPSKEEQSTGQPQHPKHSSVGSQCGQQAAILPWCVLFGSNTKKCRINQFKSAVCSEKGRFLTFSVK